MGLRQQIDDDLKAALLARDSIKVDTLRGLKSTILYADVAAKARDSGGIPDADVLGLLAKEAKKRQESADLYVQGGSQERADKELAEKAIIEGYLPAQLSDDELKAVVGEVVETQGASGMQAMGAVIGAVKAKVGNTADGAKIAQLVKERLSA
ncbi:MAG TPA: GatB/YqeY domain-containing protein [Candidatus Saccharimonadales bacterium]|nr:GatB/YqeY domain-containing protein [Candidatus Saccharimonadales bacterium]